VDSRRLGGAWTLDRVWERLGIGAAIRRVAAGRRLDGDAVERVVFALVAQRALEPASKLAATGWVADRVVIEALETLTDDQAYWAMDFLLDALEEIAGEVFASVAHLLNLDLEGTVDDDGVIRPAEQGKRTFGHSKDFRTDLPQVVIAMAVTRRRGAGAVLDVPGQHHRHRDHPHRHRRPGRVEPAPDGVGRRPRVRLGGEQGVPDPRGRALSSTPRSCATPLAVAAAALARPGRYRTVAGNLRVKEVHVAPGGLGDADLPEASESMSHTLGER